MRGEEAIAERPDGALVPFMPFPTPLHDANGNLLGAINMLVDLTQQKKAEAATTRLAAIVQQSDDAIISKNTDGIIQTWNKGAEQLFGYPAAEIEGTPINRLIPTDRPDEEPQILERIRRGEHVEHYETVRVRKDGSRVDVSISVSPLKDASGRVVGASTIARDITERRKAEERRALLTNELNHRVKNTLATVQSLAVQTFRGSDKTSAVARFEARLIALARAHDSLTSENWEGVFLNELIDKGIAAICADPKTRFRLAGPIVRLRPKVGLSLAMVLHELCTNALKYGALSEEVGRIEILWSVTGSAGNRLVLTWREIGGPIVREPTTKGFGTRLLDRVLSQELDAKVELRFPPAGVTCMIETPF